MSLYFGNDKLYTKFPMPTQYGIWFTSTHHIT